MSRLQKKCFIGATGFHLFLLGALLLGPVLLSPGKADPTPVLEFIPTITTDALVSGGGTPRPPTPIPTPPAPQQPSQPEVQPQVAQPPPEREPDPSKVEKVKQTKTDPDSPEPKPEKRAHQVKVSDKVINPRDLKKSTKPPTDATAAATARAAAERKQQFAAALNNIKSGLTSSTTIEMPDGPNGPGGGGPSYANYAQVVRKIYTDAWRTPEDVTDDEATVKVSVTIARGGNVISSRIIQSSGSKLVDKSIQATLDRVTFVATFPEGAKELQRTFTISFSLKAKKIG